MEDKVRVSCLRCGATNNFPLDRGGKKVVCGRCRSELPEPGTVIEASPDVLASLIQNGGLPVLVDFYSPSCAPCRMMHPLVERLAKRRRGEIMVLRINTELYPDVAAQLQIQAVPTFIIVSRGTERGRTAGAMPETDFSLWVASRT